MSKPLFIIDYQKVNFLTSLSFYPSIAACAAASLILIINRLTFLCKLTVNYVSITI